MTHTSRLKEERDTDRRLSFVQGACVALLVLIAMKTCDIGKGRGV